MQEQQYRLRVPFKLAQELAQPLEIPTRLMFETLQIELSVQPPRLVLTAEPFDSEGEARSCFDHVWNALAWASVKLGTGFFISRDFAKPKLVRDLGLTPEEAGMNFSKAFKAPYAGPIDGSVDGDRPSIIPLGLRISFLGSGEATGTLKRSTKTFLNSLQEGLNFQRASGGPEDRLRIAIELFSESHRERSVRAQFLTITTALEVLAEPEPKHDVARSMLASFRNEVRAAREQTSADSESWHALDSLERDTIFRSESSIRSRVRRLALNSCSDSVDAIEHVKQAVWAYDQRSALLHRGFLADADLQRAHDIAQQVLRDAIERRLITVPA